MSDVYATLESVSNRPAKSLSSNLNTINHNVDALSVVEADKSLDTSTFVRWVWVEPNKIFMLVAFDS